MPEIPKNSENPKTPEENPKGNGNASGGELTSEQMQAKMKMMS